MSSEQKLQKEFNNKTFEMARNGLPISLSIIQVSKTSSFITKQFKKARNFNLILDGISRMNGTLSFLSKGTNKHVKSIKET